MGSFGGHKGSVVIRLGREGLGPARLRGCGQPQRAPLGVLADGPPLDGMHHASAQHLHPGQHRREILHGKVGHREGVSRTASARVDPPRAERSTGTASPPLPCARGSSGAPSRPPQKRSARSGSSAGNSIKAGLDRAIGTTLRQPAGLDDPDPGHVRPRRNAATRPLGSTELRLSEQPLDQIEVLDQLRMARNSSRTRSRASRPTEPARSTARCVFAGAGWVRVGACDSAAERCPWRRSHFGSCS